MTGEEFAILSFNFNSKPRDASVDGVAGSFQSISATGLPAPRAGEWINLEGARGVYGDQGPELVVDENGRIMPGITLGWDVIEYDDNDDDDDDDDGNDNRLLDSHNNIRPGSNQDKRLFEGYITGDRKDIIQVRIDGLAAHYQEYDVYVYTDADDRRSDKHTSIRKITFGADDVFFLSDRRGSHFSGNHVLSTSVDRSLAGVGNYVAVADLDTNSLVIEIEALGGKGDRPAISRNPGGRALLSDRPGRKYRHRVRR